MKIFLFAAGLILSCNVFAQQGYVCKHGEVVRTVEVVYSNPGEQVPCEVVYTRTTGARALWSAENQVGYCESKAEAFINKHQREGFTCTEHADLQNVEIQDIGTSGIF